MKVLIVLTNRNHSRHSQCRDIKLRDNYIKVETDDDRIYIYPIDRIDSFTIERN